MKKVTVILSMFVMAVSSQTFAQNAAQPAPVKINPAPPKPGETGYMEIKMEKAVGTSAQPKPTAKPKPAAKIAQPKPGTKTPDFFLEIETIKGESKD